jgi:hypothetical protein
MNNEDIIQFATGYREDILKGRSSHLMCWVVTQPLSLVLKEMGVDNEIVCYDVDVQMSKSEEYQYDFGVMEHFCIKIGNKILDATADQFEGMEGVYFGSRPIWYLDPM